MNYNLFWAQLALLKSQDLFKFNAREDKSLNLEKIQSARYVGYILEIPDPRRIEAGTAANIQEKRRYYK